MGGWYKEIKEKAEVITALFLCLSLCTGFFLLAQALYKKTACQSEKWYCHNDNEYEFCVKEGSDGEKNGM